MERYQFYTLKESKLNTAKLLIYLVQNLLQECLLAKLPWTSLTYSRVHSNSDLWSSANPKHSCHAMLFHSLLNYAGPQNE